MDTKKTIRKILFVTMWLVIGTGMLTLLIAAMDKQKKELCKGYEIKIKTEPKIDFFLDQEGISKLLKAAAKGDIKGKMKSSFNLLQMEKSLEDNVWIKDAQLYFDNHAVLHVSVEEREPVARIFTAGGRSFYMDENLHSMPLSEKTIARVPVFTGFPDKKLFNKDDSVLLNDINTTAHYISTHSFWSSQVAQVDIVNDCGKGCWEFEMVPVVGRHVVKLGNGENIDQKFQRLFAFYQQVLTGAGLDHYKTIDVRFAGQVIGGKSDNPKTDSLKLAKSVDKMLHDANQMLKEEIDAEEQTRANQPGGAATVQPVNETNNTIAITDNPKPNENKRVPKAIMPQKQQRSNN